MADPVGRSVVEGEVRALRQEVAELRAEQKAMMAAIEEMSQTFRAIASQLGIAGQPYRRGPARERDREQPPGFA